MRQYLPIPSLFRSVQYVILISLGLFSGHLTFGQDTPAMGLQYQAVARMASGQPIPNTDFEVEVNITDGAGNSEVFFAERHQVTTDDNGYFQLNVGSGTQQSGTLVEVPWAEKSVYIHTRLSGMGNVNTEVEQISELLSVPYAIYARTADDLVPEKVLEARNQSIYWLTSGNLETRPPVHFLGNRDARSLVIKTDSTIRAIFTDQGQLEIYSGVTGAAAGDDQIPGKYPMTVEGSTQGIWITVDGSRSSETNFVAFADVVGGFQGRIEGQTIPELLTNPFYLIQNGLYILEGVKIGVGLVTHIGEVTSNAAAGSAALASIFCAFAAPGFYAAAVAEGINVTALGIEAAALLTNSISWNAIQLRDIGVVYNSGGADYAEYLERHRETRNLNAGEIVGIKNGLLTLNTSEADHIKVISTGPAFLGNMPRPEVEDSYEKVAFMGQALVKVLGAVENGDYILPSGKNDGIGIAVSPEEMQLEDYKKVVGVAWESNIKEQVKYVTISIGLNRNDIAPQVEEISNKIDHIINYLEGNGPLRPQGAADPASLFAQSQTPLEFTPEEFDRMVDEKQDALRAQYDQAAKDLIDKGFKLEQFPGLTHFLEDPIQGLKDMRRNPDLRTYWAQLDKMLIQHQQTKNN